MPRQPGHWLLVIAGFHALVSWPLYLLTRKMFDMSLIIFIISYRLPLTVLFFVLAGYAMTRMPAERMWRKMFLFWILANAIPLLGFCCFETFALRSYFSIPDLLVGIALSMAFLLTGFLDFARGARRDHLHWVGVACRVAYVGWVVLEIVRIYLPRP